MDLYELLIATLLVVLLVIVYLIGPRPPQATSQLVATVTAIPTAPRADL